MLFRHKSRPQRIFSTPCAGLQQSSKSHANLDRFSGLIKYLVTLRRDGTLIDSDFGELVRMASAAFIEAEVSDKESIKLLAVFLGGFGGGFGVKSYMDRDK